MRTSLNHVAFLVKSIETVLQRNSFSPDDFGEIEEFPSEGTRELYVGRPLMGRVLLIQAVGEGPYQRALAKRGDGLHHLALDVEDLDKFVGQLSGSGWYLHPSSLDSYKSKKQVYLCRPNIPVLIEIQERNIFEDDSYFIQKIEFPFGNERLLKGLHCGHIFENRETKLFGKDGSELRMLL